MNMKKPKLHTLIFPLLGLCIIALTILKSYEAVSGLSRSDPTYYTLLEDEISRLKNAVKSAHGAEENFRREEDLAVALWQSRRFTEAGKHFIKLWKEEQPKCSKGAYNPHFVDNGLNLAGLYLDSGNFKQSQACYESILKYEQDHLKSRDLRIARDENNLGLSHYMMAQTSEAQRYPELKKALQCYKHAEETFRLSPSANVQLVANLQNQALALEDLGQRESARDLDATINTSLASWHQKKVKQPANPVSTQLFDLFAWKDKSPNDK